MTTVDWLIVATYVAATIMIGLRFARKASTGASDFFLAGRSLPWFIAGTSMVATTFSSDTPLWVAGAARSDGLSTLWIMWSALLGTLATVFFFARLWRRSEVLTEVELVVRRYDKTPAMHALRVFKALFDGVFVNCVIMASVTLAMLKVIVAVLGLTEEPVFFLPLIGGVPPDLLVLTLLGTVAVLYTMLSGLYGVVYTDLIQFGLAMIGAFALAIITYVDLASGGGFMETLKNAPNFDLSQLDVFPDFGWNLQTATFLILMSVGWLFGAPGTGFYLQRILATRSERDAMLSVYWYCFCHYILRSWPWIVVGIASIVYFPGLLDAESSYPEMADHLLPAGLKGVMVASLLAAFMSTLDTHMNWGASYLVNDIYKPYLRRQGSRKHYVAAGRVCMVALAAMAVLVATRLTGLLDAYKYLAVFWGGVSFVLIARWYWWRINAWSELATLAFAAVFGNALFVLLPDTETGDLFAVRMLVNFTATTLICILVTYLTSRPGPSKRAVEFYRRMRIHGPGWRRVRRSTGVEPIAANLTESTILFLASALFMYGLLFACGYALFLDWARFAVCVALVIPSGVLLYKRAPGMMAEITGTGGSGSVNR